VAGPEIGRAWLMGFETLPLNPHAAVNMCSKAAFAKKKKTICLEKE